MTGRDCPDSQTVHSQTVRRELVRRVVALDPVIDQTLGESSGAHWRPAGGRAMWDAYMGAPWTRDGTVRAYVVTMAPEVAGRIVNLPIAHNKYVRRGDLLMFIDPTDYTIRVSQAEAAVQQAEASVQNSDAQIAVQQAQISANAAQLDRANAALVFVTQQAGRYGKLAQDG